MISYLLSFFNWFYELFSFTKTGSGNLLLLGLDNAGKTTLLYRLKTGKIDSFPPTKSLNAESVKVGNIIFKTIDLGGQTYLRKLWEDYMVDVSGVIFVIDSCDKERFKESKKVLNGLLRKKELANIPFVILCNKCDKKKAIHSKKILNEFKVNCSGRQLEKLEKGTRPIELFDVSVLKGINLKEAFDWFAYHLKNKNY